MPASPSLYFPTAQGQQRYPGSLGSNVNAFGSAVLPNAPDPLAPLPDASASPPVALVPVNGAKPPVGTPPFAMPHPDTGGAQPAGHPPGMATMLAALLHPEAPQQHGIMGFIDRVANPTNSLGEIGRALLVGGGGPLGNTFALLDEHQKQMQAARQQQAQLVGEGIRYDQTRQDQLDERNYQQNKPEFFSGKEDRVKYDPATGTTSTVYDAPSEAQTYADTLGYAAGTPDYNKAVQDYVLRAHGPTAIDGLVSLEGVRFGDRSKLETLRAGNRSTLEDQRAGNRTTLKGVPTYRDTHQPAPGSLGPPRTTGNVYAPILGKIARGEPLSPGEQQALSMRGSHGRYSGPVSGGVAEGATATGPGGKRVVMRGGNWVPIN